MSSHLFVFISFSIFSPWLNLLLRIFLGMLDEVVFLTWGVMCKDKHTQICCKCIFLICHFSFEYANSVVLPCKISVRQIFSFIGPEIWLWLKNHSLHSRYKEIWPYIVSFENLRSSVHLYLLIYMEWDMDPILLLNQIIIQLSPNLLFINDHLFPSDLRCLPPLLY